MKKFYMVLGTALAAILSSTSGHAQWSFTVADQADTISFDEVVPGVVNDFNGSGFTPAPTLGQLDSDAWRASGFSTSSSFGDTQTSGDFARGASAGSVGSGGIYGFEVAAGDTALGIQPGGSDFTPGDLDLLVINNTGGNVDTVSVSYEFWVYNDQPRSNTYNFSYLVGSTSGTYTAVPALSDTTIETASGSPSWTSTVLSADIPVALADGDSLVLRWTGDDYQGGSSRDEVAFDDIIVELSSGVAPTPLVDSLVITEIMYNLPGNDSVEFIEMQNIGSTPIDLTGFSFTQGVTYNFPSVTVNAGDYFLVTNDSVEFFNTYGFSAYEWTTGGLSNSGEDIVIVNASNATVDSVDYDDNNPWPVEADGLGWSLTLTNTSSDNNVGTNWCLSGNMVSGYVINGIQMYSSPGASDTCYVAPVVSNVPTYTIAEINNVDPTTGAADSLGVTCWTKGVVLGVDMDGNNGISFTIWDNEGINVYNANDVSNYVVNEGDSILIRGTVGQFGGLTQISPDSIQLVNTGNVIPTPTVITDLDETTESELVRFENVYVHSVTPTGTSGTNYVLVSGTDTLAMRVDNDTDVDDSLTIVVGDSLCYVIGIGSQRDFGTPALSGYQFLPRYYTDIDTTCGGSVTPTATPTYPVADINNVDVDGVADSNGVYCWTKGIVLGVNMRPAGLQFTIWDNEGINVFSFNGVSNYMVNEGDSILVRGTVGQFNGLTQLSPDSIQLVNSGNVIPTPTVVTTLSEATESELIRIENVLVAAVNPTGGSGTNYDLVMGTDTLTMRVDNDTDVDDSLMLVVGDSLCHVIGIGGQFDNSSPYTSGYQILPRFYTDIDTTCGGSITPPVTPEYEIADINNVDADGVADSNGVYCWTEGVVLGVNMRPSGLQFTVWDVEGIGVFNNTGDLGYTVAEGDLIRIKGTVSQFNGLTQINPDEVVLVSSNNTIPVPEVVSTLSEDTESELVRVNNLMVAGIDSSSSAINYALVSGADTITMRVDLDTDVEDNWSLAINDSLCYVIGIGGQFDNSSPYTSGYQLFPRTFADLDTASCIVNSVNVLSAKEGFAVYPNPVSGSELFFNQVADVVVYNTTGSIVMDAKQVNRIAVDQLKAGVYIIRTANAEVVRVVVR